MFAYAGRSTWSPISFHPNKLAMELRQGISNYRQTSNIRRNSVGNKIVDQSDVFVASPVGATPTTSSLST